MWLTKRRTFLFHFECIYMIVDKFILYVTVVNLNSSFLSIINSFLLKNNTRFLLRWNIYHESNNNTFSYKFGSLYANVKFEILFIVLRRCKTEEYVPYRIFNELTKYCIKKPHNQSLIFNKIYYLPYQDQINHTMKIK